MQIFFSYNITQMLTSSERLRQAHGEAEWRFEQLAVAAAACVLHPLLVPQALVAQALPRLAADACGGGAAAGGAQQALAAALLAEGLAGPLGARALPHLGPLPALVQRCACLVGYGAEWTRLGWGIQMPARWACLKELTSTASNQDTGGGGN